MLTIPQIEALRRENPYLYESLRQIVSAVNSMGQRLRIDPQPSAQSQAGTTIAAPSAPISLAVTGARGAFTATIGGSPVTSPAPGIASDSTPIVYFLEAASNPAFNSPTVYSLGPALTANLALGNVSRYWRVRAKFIESGYSLYTYFGTQANPTSVSGGQVNLAAGADTSGSVNLDSQVQDGATFGRVTQSALSSGSIDPTKSGVLTKGSIPPTWNGSFTYASTTSSITWSWSGLSIFRADGTTTSVANGSLSVTGLASATTYFFYPYWDDVGHAIAWVAGGSGSPANALNAKTNAAAQQQSLQGNIPLSQGAMLAATTAAGTGGGSGGGSGSCLRSGAVVLSRDRGTVPIESCRVGEKILGRDGWTRIIRHEVIPADTFIRLYFSNQEILDVTPHHIFTLADGSPMRAERLCLSDLMVGRFSKLTLRRIETIVEEGSKVSVGCEPCHEFYAGRHAATVLTHNWTFAS